MFLEISQNSQETTCARRLVSSVFDHGGKMRENAKIFLLKTGDWFRLLLVYCARDSLLIKKESLTRVFSCEFCEISKNTFFTEHLRTTAVETRFSSFCALTFLVSISLVFNFYYFCSMLWIQCQLKRLNVFNFNLTLFKWSVEI